MYDDYGVDECPEDTAIAMYCDCRCAKDDIEKYALKNIDVIKSIWKVWGYKIDEPIAEDGKFWDVYTILYSIVNRVDFMSGFDKIVKELDDRYNIYVHINSFDDMIISIERDGWVMMYYSEDDTELIRA